jgi:hypothetical protein
MKAARQSLRLTPCSSTRDHLWACSGDDRHRFVRRRIRRRAPKRRSPASRAALMSGAAELALPGVVKWVPLSVSTVWTL